MDTSTGTGNNRYIEPHDSTVLPDADQGVQTMFTSEINLYNFPATYAASLKTRKTGVRVMVKDSARSVSVFEEISWTSYTLEEMVWEVRLLAQRWAEQLSAQK